jgi:hypothetical protein
MTRSKSRIKRQEAARTAIAMRAQFAPRRARLWVTRITRPLAAEKEVVDKLGQVGCCRKTIAVMIRSGIGA